ncbi:hypothetical protein CVT25_002373 [Psilocybe cyanescens]|uniref:Uncharacterized protein n=1 Tax=Psilocybe cyanescens TaxID=93625 RepID=A0A409WK29_PSICY|nr:hypothetical protein CVT25_002373 [Psilocybe cyanescens]
MLTFDEEVRCIIDDHREKYLIDAFGIQVNSIWPAKLSTTKIIFLLNRYVNIASQLSMIVYFIGLTETHSRVVSRHVSEARNSIGHSPLAKTCVFFVVGYGGTVFLALASIHGNSRRPARLGNLESSAVDHNGFGTSLRALCSRLLALEYVSFLFTLASIYWHYTGVTPGLSGLQPLVRRVYLSVRMLQCAHLKPLMNEISTLVFDSVSYLQHGPVVCNAPRDCISGILKSRSRGMFWKTPYNMVAVTSVRFSDYCLAIAQNLNAPLILLLLRKASPAV